MGTHHPATTLPGSHLSLAHVRHAFLSRAKRVDRATGTTLFHDKEASQQTARASRQQCWLQHCWRATRPDRCAKELAAAVARRKAASRRLATNHTALPSYSIIHLQLARAGPGIRHVRYSPYPASSFCLYQPLLVQRPAYLLPTSIHTLPPWYMQKRSTA